MTGSPLPPPAKRAVTLTLLGLWAERLVRAFWPLWVVVLLGFIGWRVWPLIAPMMGSSVELLWVLLVLLALGLIAGLAHGLRQFWRARHVPGAQVARARVDAGLSGAPLAGLQDALVQMPGAGDQTRTIWALHQRQLQQRAAGAHAVAPDLQLSRFDPFALRYIALLIAAIFALWGAAPTGGGSTRLAGLPGGGESAIAWEGWAEPPSYTGLPTLYLPDVVGQALELPQGSLITLRFYREIGALSLDETVSARLGDVPPATDLAQEFSVETSGRIRLLGAETASWSVEMIADAPPTADIAPDANIAADGTWTQSFSAQDDYAVISGQARVTLHLAEVDRRHGLAIAPMDRDPILIELPMPFSGSRRDFSESFVENFSQHPWANLPVQVSLSVADIRGQRGTAPLLDITLPGQRFFDPVARALIEQRRDFLWAPGNAPRVAQILRAVNWQADDLFRVPAHRDGFAGIISRIEDVTPANLPAEVQDEIAQSMWDLAIEIEFGDLGDAKTRMERAQDRLNEAMRDGASNAEIQELMQELRDATRDYMREFAEQNPPDSSLDSPDPGDQETITQDQLQEMFDRLQELMEQGRMAEAQELMRQIEEMMQNLQMSEGQPGENGEGQEGQQGAMEDLSDTLREQQDLSDETFQELQDQADGQQGDQENGQQQQGQQQGDEPGQQQGGQQGEGQQGQQGQGGDEPGSLADRQRALRQELERQRGNLPGAGTEAGREARRQLDRAGRAMDRAEEALRNGDQGSALREQAEALDALREGLQGLGEALAEENGQEPRDRGQEQTGGDPFRPQSDPLGRDPSAQGNIGSDQNALTEDLERRSQELMDEIRRRSGSPERPEVEREYLRRLLDLFGE